MIRYHTYVSERKRKGIEQSSETMYKQHTMESHTRVETGVAPPLSSKQTTILTLWLKMCLPTSLKMFDHVGSVGALHRHDCHSGHLPRARAFSHQLARHQVARMASSLDWSRSSFLNILLLLLFFSALPFSAPRANLSCNSMDGASRHIIIHIKTHILLLKGTYSVPIQRDMFLKKYLKANPPGKRALSNLETRPIIRREGPACIIPYKINRQLRCHNFFSHIGSLPPTHSRTDFEFSL